jgi:tagaturonate reductase
VTRRIVQFGTSRFLQAHVDLLVHEARAEGQEIGPITIVKTTADGARTGRVEALRRAEGFPVRIRGYRNKVLVDETITVRSVIGALDVNTQWPLVVDHFTCGAEIAISNVGDRGYELSPEDISADFSSSRAPASFIAKLLALLLARHEAGGPPLLFLPCELLPSNGRTLGLIVSDLAKRRGAPTAFQDWLRHSVAFADSIVDRIVSEAIEPIGAVAEPYALWAIRRGNFGAPFAHPALVMADDLEPFERLKLHILNLSHTILAEEWMRRLRHEHETVASILENSSISEYLNEILCEEVIPGFAVCGMSDQAADYTRATLERFRNPFLNHRISDIAQNHPAKVRRRLGSFVDWVHERDPRLGFPRLSAILQNYG